MPATVVLSPEEFADAPLAYLAYAARLRPPVACAWLTAFLERPDWATHFGAWVNAANLVGYRSSGGAVAEMTALVDAVADHLDALPMSVDLHAGLGQLNINDRHLLPPRSSARARITRWIARVGGAADAPLMASWIEDGPEGRETAPLIELVRTLLERGSAELRRTERAKLATMVVWATDQYAPELRVPALRVLARNERPASTGLGKALHLESEPAEALDAVVPALENALREGAPAALAVEVVHAVGGTLGVWQTVRRAGAPLVGAALVQHAASGPDALTKADALMDLFENAVRYGHGPPRFRSGGALAAAVEALNRLGSDGGLTRAQREHLTDWTGALAEQHFAMHGLARGRLHSEGSIDRLVGWDATRATALAALRRALDAEGGSASLSQRILDAHADDPGIALAAMYALPEAIERIPVSAGGPDLNALERELGRLLLRSWPEPVGGIDMHRLLGGVRKLELGQPGDGRLCTVAGDAIVFSRDDVAGLVRGEPSPQRALAIAALYVAHELVHVAQGAGDKPVIDRLRGAGGETTLLHLDLAADHAAAVLVHEVNRDWSLVWLKQLHGENAVKYPVRRWHTAAARTRKTLRLIGLRTDLLVRELRADAVGEHEYAFADFGPGGGEFVLLASGPPWRVLGVAALGSDDATALGAAADGNDQEQSERVLAGLDAVLRRLIACAIGR